MKTKELKSSFLNCTDELLMTGTITKETHSELIAGIERDRQDTYKRITELLEEFADRGNIKRAC